MRDAKTRRSRIRRLAWRMGLLGAILVTVAVSADMVMPTVTRIFFEHARHPVRSAVAFTVHCFGYDAAPGSQAMLHPPAAGTYKPVEVFSFSAKCPHYGCEIHEPFYLNYVRIDWCDMEGRVGNHPFELKKYAPLPIDFSQCTRNEEGRNCELRIQLPD
jgi:hypothetical protein